MASIIPGYNYDIFISYRQKDNKHDGWVTDFVRNLKDELESTFKEEISVYFDINPHDGLLETYDVDASLKEKLKCLIFIPIISRTYCDPKSFAWEHEFKAFVDMASKDQFGLKVKLSNGNVCSRILPVQIHELDKGDMKEYESLSGGVLRGIDFIYKEAGVDRPITRTDEARDNLNRITYRNQINKVALAIREIIYGIQNPAEKRKSESKLSGLKVNSSKKTKKLIAGFSFAMILIITLVIFIPVLSKPGRRTEKSIAVLPFRDDSPDDSNIYFINGIMEEILNNLQSINDLRVISRTSVEQFRNTDKSITEIARELGVNYIIEGSGQKFGNTFSLSVQLHKARPKESNLWAKSYEHAITSINDIFNVKKQISQSIAAELKAAITPQEEDMIKQVLTKNANAYDLYLRGKQYYSELNYEHALEMYSKAIEEDPDFISALLVRSFICSRIYFTRGSEYHYKGNWEGFDKMAKEDLKKALELKPELPEVKLAQVELHYTLDHKYDLDVLNEIESQLSNNPSFYNLKAAILRRMGDWEGSLNAWQKQVQLDPLSAGGYIEIGHTYRLMRKYPEAIEFFRKSLLYDQNPENKTGLYLTFVFWKGNPQEALKMAGFTKNDSLINADNYFYLTRDFDKLLNTADKYEDQFNFSTRSLNIAKALYLEGNVEMCRIYADSAIPEIKKRISQSTGDERYYAALAYAYAFKGDKEKAIENINTAVKLKPLKLDSWQGFDKELDLVKIYVLTGEYDLAMDKIEYLLTIPGEFSTQLLKIDPAYDNLRPLPRYKKIINTEYITKFK